ncbi:serine O-acetyltransferase [Hufsiella ginkgonis]|uniref:Serine acetyltransferase n=1 Tax=Hufsiella ginkgonis TaxID=2695274 RepID=A0A7K1XW87_9SPHI|nr:serine acetyltransferase [Hufsiella ginkgonis]MXV14786.1 serine acetyltransferase [Hufsiella ginkgonis]
MNDHFYSHLFEKQRGVKRIPPNTAIAAWALSVINLLYPEHSKTGLTGIEELKSTVARLETELCGIIGSCCGKEEDPGKQVVADFFAGLPELYRVLNTDIQAIYAGDPAARSEFEVIRTYPGFYAICFYRIAHLLVNLDVDVIPRILTEHAHSVTGIDIHPSAVIGEYFHIDHGTGIVIGETCTIGQHVKMYQGVTLGALSVRKNMAGVKRHPTVEDRVVIYSGASILGGDTVIGHDSVIGGNVWLTESIAPYSTVYHTPMITVQKTTEKRPY